MTADVFDRFLQEANEWVKSLMMEMNWEDRQFAFKGLSAVLHTLRDRLIPEQVVKFGAQLPVLIRGFYYDGWNISRTPVKLRDEKIFFSKVRDELDGDTTLAKQIDAETLCRAVFKLITHRISPGESENIKAQLPSEIKALWPHDPNAS